MYREGSCNGAKVSLIFKEKIISNLILQPDGISRFTGVKQGKYSLVIDFPKYNLKKVVEATGGQRISIQLSERKEF